MAIHKVVVFGATGNTGLNVVKSALAEGLNVRAFVRDLEKLPEEVRAKVEPFQGDVLNPDDVQNAIQGQDGVIVALGTRNSLDATTVMSEGMKNIVHSMSQLGVKPVSVCLSAFLFFAPEKLPPRFKALTEDHERMDKVLRASTLDWIAVYPPHIADEPGSNGAYQVSHEEEKSTNFRGRKVSVHDLAHFLVKSISAPEHYKTICAIST